MNNSSGMWSSRLIFVLAAAGSAVGLGNIWRFPYVTGENGGGVFVIAYLLCIAVIGLPIMIAEIVLGRAGRSSPISSMQILARRSYANSGWQLIGWMGVIAGFMILSFYSVIAGWALAYLIKMMQGLFVEIDSVAAESLFENFIGSPQRLIFWHTAFMSLTIIITARGVGRGLEKAVKFLMPGLFFLLVLLVFWAAATSGHFLEGLDFMFSPKPEDFSGDSVFLAMGQAFFTLSLGMGAIMAYGAYLPQSSGIASSALTIGVLDTIVALLSGMIIFPIVFANQLEPSAGPGLMFVSLPLAFGNMLGGQIFGSLFFLLVTFAAITSAISISEPAIAWLSEKRRLSRAASAYLIGFLAWILGLGSALSFNIMNEFTLLPDKTFFDSMDFLSNNILLPFGGILISLFVGWRLDKEILSSQLSEVPSWLLKSLVFSLRFVAPGGIFLVIAMTFVS
ncbi:MAG: sodium-dependent transporter [Gammaproteobacteria bacterium]|nr:sodium-dependent transporter [Gammaproteobacteria bacterium]